MATYTGSAAIANAWLLEMAKAANKSSDTFRMLLLNSSWTPSQENDDILADIVANEISGNGYARQAVTMSWTRTNNIATLTFSPVTFTASGGTITARRWAIFDDTVSSPVDPVVAYGLLNNSDADVSILDGRSLIVSAHVTGLYTVTRS